MDHYKITLRFDKSQYTLAQLQEVVAFLTQYEPLSKVYWVQQPIMIPDSSMLPFRELTVPEAYSSLRVYGLAIKA